MPKKRADDEAECDVKQPEPLILNPHRLLAPHAYYEDDGSLKAWQQGQLVEDPEEIQHLLDRGAHLEEVK